MMFPEIRARYRQHLIEQKERAFMKWVASGYADFEGWKSGIKLCGFAVAFVVLVLIGVAIDDLKLQRQLKEARNDSRAQVTDFWRGEANTAYARATACLKETKP
jgi:hypothetical protein